MSFENWSELDDFKAFFNSLGLKYFNHYEVLSGVGNKRGAVENAPPPREIWHNIAPTIIVLDHLRDFYDLPITINSTYRSPEYNPLIGGASRSQHMGFTAIDFNVRGVLPTIAAEQLVGWQKMGKWFSSPVELKPVDVTVNGITIPREALQQEKDGDGWKFQYKGGVGFYNTFTHMDTRGITVDWDNRRNDSGQRSRSLTGEPVLLELD